MINEARMELLMDKDVNELTDEELKEVVPYMAEVFNGLGVQVDFDPLSMNALIHALVEIVVGSGALTQPEMDEEFRRQRFAQLKNIIKGAREAKIRAQIMTGVHQPIVKKPPHLN